MSEGNQGFFGVAQGGRNPGVGHGDDQIGFDRIFACQLPPHFVPRFVHVGIEDAAVWAGEVHQLEDTRAGTAVGGVNQRLTDQPTGACAQDLAGRNLSDKFGAHQVKGAGLRGEHVGVTQLAEHQRPKTVWIP